MQCLARFRQTIRSTTSKDLLVLMNYILKMKPLIIFYILFLAITTFSLPTVSLRFDGNYLSLINTENQLLNRWKAGAGRPFSTATDQFKKNVGPLPEGLYFLQINRTVFFNKRPDFLSRLKWVCKYIGWGDLAIPLLPSSTNKLYGRDGFMIHGGGWGVGSKGCIYVYGNSVSIYQSIKPYATVSLTVDYPSEEK